MPFVGRYLEMVCGEKQDRHEGTRGPCESIQGISSITWYRYAQRTSPGEFRLVISSMMNIKFHSSEVLEELRVPLLPYLRLPAYLLVLGLSISQAVIGMVWYGTYGMEVKPFCIQAERTCWFWWKLGGIVGHCRESSTHST